ncbi:hypothetical protein EW026_g3264 [Hermanssonia centrifuga]|uniref:Iminophenyl-pyruvate dimer synthase domain-containing protein n=1 Tax=Hermanssonia centrifuga TaxID=98765 RepID=A0A4S4KLT5_9APHY|nr:hypothetical protein EW026_g3264 [Hermanssonia centrifuga]
MDSKGSKISIPDGPPKEWGPPNKEAAKDDLWRKACVEALLQHGKAAMTIEFHTIPLYLYAAYSIIRDNGGSGTKARYAILGIVEQEMLHLSLCGNIVRALGGFQPLYDEEFVPKYDDETKLLYDEISLDLEPAEKSLLDTFIKIESPYEAPHKDLKPEVDISDEALGFAKFTTVVGKKYKSIGDFYKVFEQGLKIIYGWYPDILSNNPDVQFSSEDFFGDNMTVVKDLETALKAMTTIVDQGEGSVGNPDSHYHVFLDLYKKRDTWDCYPVGKNPTTESFKDNDYVYRLSLAFDAAYCYLLRTIDMCWENPKDAKGNTRQLTYEDKIRRQYLMRNIHAIMMDLLTPIADILVQQPFNDTQNASPCFDFYHLPQDSKVSQEQGLFDGITEELKKAMETSGGRAGGHKSKLEAILYSASQLPPNPPPSTTTRSGRVADETTHPSTKI